MSCRGTKFIIFDIKIFHLNTPPRYEYVCVKLSDIPEKFITAYTLPQFTKDDRIYFEIRKGVYGLPQAGNLANNILAKKLNAEGY